MAKDPIWSMKLPADPARSPRAEKRSAALICQGQSQSEARAIDARGNAIFPGMLTGMKYNMASPINTADEMMAAVFTELSEVRNIAIAVDFVANIVIFVELPLLFGYKNLDMMQ